MALKLYGIFLEFTKKNNPWVLENQSSWKDYILPNFKLLLI